MRHPNARLMPVVLPTATVLLAATVALTSAAADPSLPLESVGSVAGQVAIVTLGVEGEPGTNIMLLIDESSDREEPDGWVDRVFTLRDKYRPELPE